MLPTAVAQNQGLIIRLMERQVELASAVNNALDAVVSAMSQAGENTAGALEAHGRRIEGVESALAELREEGQRTPGVAGPSPDRGQAAPIRHGRDQGQRQAAPVRHG